MTGACPVPTLATTFSVSPVRIDLSAQRRSAALRVTNLSDHSTTIQAHVVTWQLQDNKAVYADTDDVLLNPPIFTLQARETQFMRLGLRSPNESLTEAAYRLILEEVPKPPEPGFTGLQTVLRISIPIFAQPLETVSPQIVWQAERSSDGSLRITASNHGKAHIQIKKLAVTEAEPGDTAFRTSTLTYLLPNQSQTWTIADQTGRNAARVRIDAVTDAGEIHEVLAPRRP